MLLQVLPIIVLGQTSIKAAVVMDDMIRSVHAFRVRLESMDDGQLRSELRDSHGIRVPDMCSKEYMIYELVMRRLRHLKHQEKASDTPVTNAHTKQAT